MSQIDSDHILLSEHDPAVATAGLMRRERNAFILGLALPAIAEVSRFFFFEDKVSREAMLQGYFAFSIPYLFVYFAILDAKSKLSEFLPSYHFKQSAAAIEELNRLKNGRAWSLFWRIKKLSDIVIFFGGFILGSGISCVIDLIVEQITKSQS